MLKNILLSSILLIPWFVHAGATAIYLSPPNLVKKEMGQIVTAYMNPLFHQNWHLFSPNPGIRSVNFCIRCKPDTEGEWTPWLDPFQKTRKKAHVNPFIGATKLMYVYRFVPESIFRVIDSHIQQATKNQTELTYGEAFELASESGEFRQAKDLTIKMCLQTYGPSTKILSQFKIIKTAPPKYSQRHLGKKIAGIMSFDSSKFSAGISLDGDKL